MLCSILDDAIYKFNIFPNEPPFHKACLIIISFGRTVFIRFAIAFAAIL